MIRDTPPHTVDRPVVRSGLASAVLCAVLAGIVPVQATDLIDRVLAVVSGSILMLSDARAAIDLGLVDVRASRDPIATALTWLIERTLLLDEAMRYDPVEPDGAAVDAAVLAARQRVGAGAAWGQALDRLGLTDESVRTLIRDTLRAQQHADRQFETPFPATEDDLRAYYDRHRDGFVRGGQPLAFDVVRDQVADQVQRERRAVARAEWVSRLRRRADVSELYLPAR
jgi:hypothetical protein